MAAVLIAVTDVTDLREAQMRGLRLSRLLTLGEPRTVVAHELNQPLTVIGFAAHNALEELEHDDTAATHLRTKLMRITRQVERACAIIDHMRLFGRGDDQDKVRVRHGRHHRRRDEHDG